MKVEMYAILLVAFITPICCISTIFVTPNDATSCPGEPCYNLSYYTENPNGWFKSYTTVNFLAGEHILDKIELVEVKYISDLTLVGSDQQVSGSSSLNPLEPASRIHCSNNEGSFYFRSIHSLVIVNLTFTNCGTQDDWIFNGALVLVYTINVDIVGTVVRNSSGGVCMYNPLGKTIISQSAFLYNGVQQDFNATTFGGNLEVVIREYGSDSSVTNIINITSVIIEGGIAKYGGGAYFQLSRRVEDFCPQNEQLRKYSIHISNTYFAANTAHIRGGGLFITFRELCNIQQVYLSNNTFTANEVTKTSFTSSTSLVGDIDTGVGGNVAIYTFRPSSTAPLHIIRIENCIIHSGKATVGAGLAIFTPTAVQTEHARKELPSISTLTVTGLVQIVDTKIINNIGVAGSGICIVAANVADSIQSFSNRIEIHNSTLANNSGYSGSAVYILTNDILPYTLENRNYFLFKNLHVQHNKPIGVTNESVPFLESLEPRELDTNASVSVALQGVKNATFIDCEFSHNNGSGLMAIQSNIIFQGRILFQNNWGENGGGLALFDSFLFPKLHTEVYFLQNHAQQAGGAIHVERELSPLYLTYCFIQPDIDTLYLYSLAEVDIQMIFEGNTAEYAGSSLYGGYIDNCIMTNSAENGDHSRLIYLTMLFGYSTKVFNSFLDVSNETGLSVISSDPIEVCICEEGKLKCDLKVTYGAIFPGSTYELSVVVVGQRKGVVPGVVRAAFSTLYLPDSHSLGELQISQSVGKNCSSLRYTIFSTNSVENITLTVDQPAPSSQKSPFLDFFIPPTISFSMLPCPRGFKLSGSPPKCDCVSLLKQHNIACNIEDQTIQRPSEVWIGYYHTDKSANPHKNGVFLHEHCSLDYCKPEESKLQLKHPNEQCAFKHSGILCGACRPGLSVAMGSSQCLKCSNKYISLLLAFLAAGIALIMLVTVCNLTVSEGAINGLIFYANIIHINHAIFFPHADASIEAKMMSVFIAWLNLDLGTETCFYNGMDTYAKTWLQLVFPLYIWTLVIGMIVSSHYSIIATKLFTRNAVKVLATLFLLSYTKLLRMIITSLSFTYLTYPDNHKTVVWLYDGNIEYLQGKHIALFIAAVLTFVFLSLPYTVILLSVRYLRLKSNSQVSTWISKWKPLFDAYTGPYKDKYCFWTGLLLLTRVGLFMVFAFNALGNPDLNLLFIGLESSSLLLFGWMSGGVYKLWPLNALESFFFMNLCVVSLSTMYTRHGGGNQAIAVYISVGTALVTFTGILIYYTGKRISNSRTWKDIMKCNTTQRIPPMTTDQELLSVSSREQQSASDSESPDTTESTPRVQHLRLTFDENNDAVLIVDDDY